MSFQTPIFTSIIHLHISTDTFGFHHGKKYNAYTVTYEKGIKKCVSVVTCGLKTLKVVLGELCPQVWTFTWAVCSRGQSCTDWAACRSCWYSHVLEEQVSWGTPAKKLRGRYPPDTIAQQTHKSDLSQRSCKACLVHSFQDKLFQLFNLFFCYFKLI